VARDRKRAKQRRERGRAAAARSASAGTLGRDPGEAPGPAGELPAALEHASSNVDEFDVAVARGAGGVTADPEEVELAERADEAEREAAAENAAEDLLQTPGAGGGGRDGGPGRGDGGPGRGDGAGRGDAEERPSGAPLREGNRVIGFLRASWAELQRVQWPDRRGVTQATAVVIGFVAIAGAYLGLADFVAKEIVEVILG
jgi:preprotein translocase subunit SecE